MKVLALCGSLRQHSRSRALLHATQLLSPDHVHFEIFEGIGELPLFNPDHESNPPIAVQRLWNAIAEADAILIASPEYAHGVTGTIKNALDWLVGYIPFASKPVAVFNPSHRAEHADAALREILNTMAARFIPGACLRIAVTANKLTPQEIAADVERSRLIRGAFSAIESYINIPLE